MVKLFKRQKLSIKIVVFIGFLLIVAGSIAYFTPCSENKSCFASVSEALLGQIEKEKKDEEILPEVFLINIEEYQKNNFAISATGQAETSDQVEIRSQVSEKVKSINVQIGQEVKPGQVLVVFENDSVQAQMMQAEAGLEVAEAQLSELEKGARSEQLKIVQDQFNNAKLSYEQAKDNLENTKERAQADIERAYSSAQNFLISTADTAKASILFATDLQYKHFLDSSLKSIKIMEIKESCMNLLFEEGNAGRWDIRAISDSEGGLFGYIKTVSGENDIDLTLMKMEVVLRRVKDLLNVIPIYEISEQEKIQLTIEKNTINGQITAITSSNQGISVQKAGSNSLITGAEISYIQAKTGFESAENQLNLLLVGATEEQLATRRAQVKLAQAQVLQARSQLSKTIIISPISGRVGVLSVRKAELVNPGQLIIAVVNDTGFQITSYIDSSNISKVSAGNSAIIEGEIEGIVTNVSPSIDPIKKKVEVKISLLEESSHNIVVGQFVNINISINQESISSDVYLLPLSSIKISSEKSVVFTLNSNNEIVENEVILGNIVGESIEVLDGLDKEMSIILFVRGLIPGTKVKT